MNVDSLPETPGQLLLVTPSSLPGRRFVDRMGRFAVLSEEPHTLNLVGSLQAGRYQMRCVFRSGTFDTTTLMLRLTEWPSRQEVSVGPFDFDHTRYRMVVPTFRVVVNGTNLGLVWCEVPSPEDMNARRVRALWGIEVARSGWVAIELVIAPEDRHRLRWSDLGEMDLIPDDRYSLPLPATVRREVVHPRLLATPSRFAEMADPKDSVSSILRARWRRFLEQGKDGTYAYRPIALALAARLTGEERWLREAKEWALRWVSRENWGYHDVPEIMGWNNDRDAGDRMFQMAIVLDWLYDQLAPSERSAIVSKLADHADLAYRVTLLQKNYWYHRCPEAHGQGLWNGLAAASVALLGHDPRAVRWLEWTLGGFDDAVRHLPSDGVAAWSVFNVLWHGYTLAILETFVGRRLADYAFFRSCAQNVLQVLDPGFTHGGWGAVLLYLARRHRCPRTQADAFRVLGLDPRAAGDPAPDLFHPLSVLFYDPAIPVGKPHTVRAAFCSEGGLVVCRGRNSTRFNLEGGTPAGPRQHAAHNFINRWYGVANAGSFEWAAEWTDAKGRRHHHPFQHAIVKSYRHDTVLANVISVDGRGHLLDRRWLGSALPLHRVAFLEHFASDGRVAYGCVNATHAYADEFEVRLLLREWVFFHACGLVVMRDRIVTAQPRRLVWHLHAIRDPWLPCGPLSFATQAGPRRLLVRAVATALDGQARDAPGADLHAEVRPSCFVPPYTMGLNLYKTAHWQPELRPPVPRIPPFPDLQIRPGNSVAAWDLITVMGVDVDLQSVKAEAREDAWRVHGLPNGGEVLWPRAEQVMLPGAPEPVGAAVAARRHARGGWVTFHTVTGPTWARRRLEPPADLAWDRSWKPRPLRTVASWPAKRRGGAKIHAGTLVTGEGSA